MTDDPGPEFWARQHRQLVVVNAIQRWMDAEPDRFTGLSTNGSGRVTLYVVDMSTLERQPLRAMLDDARAAGIEVAVEPAERSLRELNRILDEIRCTDPFETRGVRAAEFGLDPARGGVRVVVAESAVEIMREAFRAHGDAVVVTGVPFADTAASFPPRDPPPADWRTPPPDLVGRPLDDAADLLRGAGFHVEVHQRGDPMLFTLDLFPDRVRILVDAGRVLDTWQG